MGKKPALNRMELGWIEGKNRSGGNRRRNPSNQTGKLSAVPGQKAQIGCGVINGSAPLIEALWADAVRPEKVFLSKPPAKESTELAFLDAI